MKALNPSTGNFEEIYVKALDSLPVGIILEYPITSSYAVPDGYRLCDGSAISRTTYSELFALIGTKYGLGDGSTTFNLPDYRGRTPVCYKNGDSDFAYIGETGGSKTDDLSNAYAKMIDDGSGKLYINVSGGKNWDSTNYLTVSGSTSASQNLTYGVNLGGTISTLQPYIVTNYIIKVRSTRPLTASVVNESNNSTTDTYSCDYINDCNSCLTSEVNTGKTWIDSKPIYRKVFTGNAPSTDWADFATYSLNIDTITSVSGLLKQDENWSIPINTYESNDYYILVACTTTYISYKKNGWTSNPTLHVILEYTKTTD